MVNGWRIVGCVLVVVLVVFFVLLVKRQVEEHNLQDDPLLHTLKDVLKSIHPIFEELQLYKGEKSYTINKKKVFLCLKDENGEYYPMNMLIYVLLHEVAHVLNTEDVGHTEAFHRKFDELLERAIEKGIYNPDIPILIDYCQYND